MTKVLPELIIWELWRSRCAARYGAEPSSISRSQSFILQSLIEITCQNFHRLKLQATWGHLQQLVDQPMTCKTVKVVRWEKPPEHYYKLNTDGSCQEGQCGAGGIIRDYTGEPIMAYSIFLGEGTSNWAESQAMLYGLQKCEVTGLHNIIVEADSKLLTTSIKGEVSIPWRMSQNVEKIRKNLKEIEDQISALLS